LFRELSRYLGKASREERQQLSYAREMEIVGPTPRVRRPLEMAATSRIIVWLILASGLAALACPDHPTAVPVPGVLSKTELPAEAPAVWALINGKWFDGNSFRARTVYSVNGRFRLKKPVRVDRTLDLAGTWIVPPFAEAHNHNITGIEERDRATMRRYLDDGVFYVKIQGNLALSEARKRRLPMNRPDGPDVALGQTFLTATGGHPIYLHENILLPQGFFPGHTRESLKDHLYFTIDSEADLEKKWPLILRLRPDFIKTNLWCSDEFARRKDDPTFFGRKGLDPRLLPRIVAKAHASRLRVSAHVTNAADFHHAVAAGVDEVAHIPGFGMFKALEDRFYAMVRGADSLQDLASGTLTFVPLSPEDVKRAARRGTVVITTAALALRGPGVMRAAIQPVQAANLRLLLKHRVALAIGSDNVADSSLQEFEYLRGLGVFDNLTLLKMWTETSARTIFPQRKIGALKEGYEASFLALEGNPLEDLTNVRKIRVRFKQGVLLGGSSGKLSNS
jgi:imidazolonepropionase-like amidohydrolase